MTEAAEEIGISQPVVSQRIRTLEEYLGLSLFDRRGGRLTLTQEGERFYHEVERGLSIISVACEETRRNSESPKPTVSIAAGSGFTHLCLLPLMPALKAAFPDCRFNVVPVDRNEDTEMQSADIAIRFGRKSATRHSDSVAMERVLPVCSPAYAVRQGLEQIRGRNDLERLTLLHQDTRDPRWLDWKQWARAAGITPLLEDDIFSYRNYPLVLNAALEGKGVALGWVFIVEKYLASGQLVAVGPEVAREDYGYWMELKYPDNVVTQPVKAWLISALYDA
jgi:DNA-binding transcriptional LysR family regulator